jgi:hypothetical protein
LKYAASRFAHEAAPALSHFAEPSPESVFDFVQGITAVARSKPQQDARLVMETKAKVLMEKVRLHSIFIYT